MQLAGGAQVGADGRVGDGEHQADNAEDDPGGRHALPRSVDALDAEDQTRDGGRQTQDRKEPGNQAKQPKA